MEGGEKYLMNEKCLNIELQTDI